MAGREGKRSPLGISCLGSRAPLGGDGFPPGDPYAYRMAPVRRGPKARSGAAVAEPEDDSYRAYPPRRA
jgi:hypothetical protein